MIDSGSKRKLSQYSNFETRSLNVLELLESIFGPLPLNPVNIAHSILIEIWSRFIVLSDFNFTVDSPLVTCILSIVNVKPPGVWKLFCDHPNLIWDHVDNILARPLTSITKGPDYAVTCNFTNSVDADMDFRHCLSL